MTDLEEATLLHHAVELAALAAHVVLLGLLVYLLAQRLLVQVRHVLATQAFQERRLVRVAQQHTTTLLLNSQANPLDE